MSKFIVINTSNGIIASTHSSQELADKGAKKLKGIGHVVETLLPAKKGDLWFDLTAIDDAETFEVEQALAEQPAPADEAVELAQTVSYTAKPHDSRCAWWCVQLPADLELNDQRIPAPYLRQGADLELKSGDMLIDSEAMHHRKNRGYTVVLIVCVDNEIKYIHPMTQRKAFIKTHGGQDLMHESGDVAGCVRMAVWLRRQPHLSTAVKALQTCN
jgi:hypothetical protein